MRAQSSGGRRGAVSGDPETQLLAVGAVSGGLAGVVLGTSSVPLVAGVVLGVALGTAYVIAFRPYAGSLIDHVFRTTALSVPAWIVLGLTVAPLLQGGLMLGSLTAEQVFVDAGIWMGSGVVLAVGTLVGARVLELRPETPTTEPSIGVPPADEDAQTPAGGGPATRIVIAGGGFAGLETAQRLEELFGPDPSVEIVLISESNSILFTPLLAEVAAGSLDPTDIATPLRTALTRTHVVNASVASVDPDARELHLEDPTGPADADISMDGRTIQYSHLVLSIGAETDYKGLEDVKEEAFSFTTIDDAIALRNHIINCLERAEQEPDPQVRESLLRVVIAGGGFAGSELAGALNDFIRDILVHYPNIDEEEVELTVVHSGDLIMPELSDSLAEYAQEEMADRGVTFKLDTRVAGASPGQVSLNDGTELRTETLVWTAGVKPHPMLQDEDVPTTEWGAVDTNADLSVSEYPGLWAVGDCASMPRPDEDGYYPNTAEHGMRAGKVLGDNIYAEERGGTRKPFRYTSPGSLVVVGYQTACAELFDMKFSGLFAWLIWRAVYLVKLPGIDRKHRVLIDWIAELAFSREMAQTIGDDLLDTDGPEPRSRDEPEASEEPEPLTSRSADAGQSALPSDQPTKLTERHADTRTGQETAQTEDTPRLQQHE